MESGHQLSRINEKMQDLLRRYEALQKENERLRGELIPAKEREIAFMERIGQLEQKIMILKTSSATMDERDKKELDKKLHGYLKDIDRCISMLSE